MFFIIVALILTAGISFSLNLITSSNWFLFLWIPVGLLIALIIVVLFILLFIFLCPKSNPKGNFRHFILRNATFLIVKFCNIHVDLYGKENLKKGETYVIYGNHKSMLDPVIIYNELHIKCTAIGKSELFNNKIMISIKDTFGAISLNRNNTREAVKSINLGIETLKDGLSVIIFPEGGILTRDEEKMSGLRAGAYKLAIKSERSILPITLVGTSHIATTKLFKRKHIKLYIHKPITYEEFKDMNTNQIGMMVEDIINGDISEQA